MYFQNLEDFLYFSFVEVRESGGRRPLKEDSLLKQKMAIRGLSPHKQVTHTQSVVKATQDIKEASVQMVQMHTKDTKLHKQIGINLRVQF